MLPWLHVSDVRSNVHDAEPLPPAGTSIEREASDTGTSQPAAALRIAEPLTDTPVAATNGSTA
jgi:hypothetical protein